MKKKTIKFKGSIINVPEMQCAVINAPTSIISSQESADSVYEVFKSAFPHLPIVFMYIGPDNSVAYYGEPEVSEFMAQYPIGLIKWGKFEI